MDFAPGWRLERDGKSLRAADARGVTACRPEEATATQGFPRTARILRSNEFSLVLREGSRCRRPLIQLYARPGATGSSRVGFIISRKVGKAHDRNRLRRVLRETFRLEILPFPGCWDIVVQIQPRAGETPSLEIRNEFLAAIGKLGIRNQQPDSRPSDPAERTL